jgi:hypothetical protein
MLFIRIYIFFVNNPDRDILNQECLLLKSIGAEKVLAEHLRELQNLKAKQKNSATNRLN